MKNFFIFLFFSFSALAQDVTIYKKYWDLPTQSLREMHAGEPLIDTKVSSSDTNQKFEMKAMALHNKKCQIPLKKLSRLENYSQLISFIKSSEYDEASKLWTVRADHKLLPFPMIVHIIVERPTKEGVYKFVFPSGMFTGLRGTFHIKNIDNRCLFFAESFWSGPKTKIPNLVIEIFSKTLSRMAADILMRKTQV